MKKIKQKETQEKKNERQIQTKRKIERIIERNRRAGFGMKNEISERNEKTGRHIENYSLLFCRYWIKKMQTDGRTMKTDGHLDDFLTETKIKTNTKLIKKKYNKNVKKI